MIWTTLCHTYSAVLIILCMVWGLQRSKYITLMTMADFILFCGGKKLRCVSNQEKLHPECVTGSVILDQEGSWFKGKDGHVIQIHGTNIYQKCLHWHIISSVPSASNQSAFFMQDSSPCHAAQWVNHFLDVDKNEIMKWLAQSPEMNPTENLWDFHWGQSYARENHHSYQTVKKYGKREKNYSADILR